MNKIVINPFDILAKAVEIYVWGTICYLTFIKSTFNIDDLRTLIGFGIFYTIYIIKKDIKKLKDSVEVKTIEIKDDQNISS